MRPSLLVVGLLALCAMVASAQPGSLEGGLVMPTFPDRGLEIGGAIGLHLFDMPEWVPIFGQLIPRHKCFADAMLITDAHAAIGGSVSVRPAEDDNGLRAGVAVWKEWEHTGWTLYLRNSWPLDFSLW